MKAGESTGETSEVTALLRRAEAGDASALDQCLPLVYDELRRIASRVARRGRRGATLATTALVNEAYLRLAGSEVGGWADRGHFFAVAARAMRFIQVDHARQRLAAKRGGDQRRLDLDLAELPIEQQADLVVEVGAALERLSEIDPRMTQVVECRFFAGYTEQETAEILKISDRTVRRLWVKARAWLYSFLGEDSSSRSGDTAP